LYVSSRGGDFNVYVMKVGGTAVRRITGKGETFAPEWSPDGTEIAYTSSNEICVMNADGSSQMRLTNDPATDFMPALSP